MSQKCSAVCALSGRPVEICFGHSIESASDAAGAAPGRYVAPGFIELQVNGFAGVDFNSPVASREELAGAIRALFATGVTRFFPTVITGSPDDMAGALRNLSDARESLPEGGAIEGFHVEGPHISAEEGPRGAHPRRWVRRPDIHELHRWQDAARGRVRIVTLSPEWPEAPRYIEAAVREGIVVSIGHTGASPAQIAEAVSAGASMSTHLGNGAHATLPRHPNYIWEQLADDRLAAGFIADGIHLPPAFVKVALRTKPAERRILVTDAVMAAGAAPGRYRLGELEVELGADDRVVLPGTTRLAGSALRLHRAVANAMRFAGVSLAEAIAMVTVNPARAVKIEGRQAGLAPGERGDLVEFNLNSENQTLEIQKTYLDGNPVYERV